SYELKYKRENDERCTFTYKTRPSAEFGPPSLFTICSCRRELAHRFMGNRQLQVSIDATLKNGRHAKDFKVFYKPGREKLRDFEQSFLLLFKRGKVVRQHFRSFRTGPLAGVTVQ